MSQLDSCENASQKQQQQHVIINMDNVGGPGPVVARTTTHSLEQC